MKSTKLYTILALGAALAAPSIAQAQVEYESEAVSVTEFTCDNSDHYFANWRNNWFIQLGAGVNQPMVERGVGKVDKDIKSVDKDKMTATYNFGFGRWISPYLALRINAVGGSLHWDNPTIADPNGGWSHAKHVNVNLELMWDMCNSIAGVNPNRPVSVIPFIGLGGDYTWKIHDGAGNPAAGTNILNENGSPKASSWTLPVTAGIQFRFRLCKYVDFFAEARASFYGDNWLDCAYAKPIEANVAAIGGLSFNIGGRNWNNFNECYYVSQIADLNNQVNDLRATVLNDQQAIAALEAQLPCPEPVVVEQKNMAAPMLTNVRFTINSDVITPEEEVNVYNVAEWMKANPNEKIVVCGYADKDTGTSEYNMALSKRRADAVAAQLTNLYNINPSRIIVKYDGSDVQPYPANNDWNRIVIFTQK